MKINEVLMYIIDLKPPYIVIRLILSPSFLNFAQCVAVLVRH